MDEMVIHLAAAACAVIFIGMAIFQVLLTLGFPLGEATMGGYHKVLPQKLRFASGGSAILLLVMGLVLLEQSELVSIGFNVKLINSLTWFFTLYLAFNSVVNFLSKSKNYDSCFKHCLCAVFSGGSGIDKIMDGGTITD